MLGYFFTVLSILGTSYVFANYLSPTVYGQYKYLLSIGTVITAFSLSGLGQAVAQGAAKGIPGFYSYATKIGLKYGFIVSLIALVGSSYYFLKNDTDLALGFLCIAILQPLFNNSGLFSSYLQGKEAFRASTHSHIVKTIITTISIVLAALYFNDPLILLCTYLATYTLVNYTIEFLLKPAIEKTEATPEVKLLINYAKHTSVRNIFTGIAGQVDKILIFQNLSAADLAVYAFATALPEQFKSITKSINLLLIPRFSRHEEADIRRNMLNKSVVYFIILLAMVMSYILIAPYIFNFFFPMYQEAIFMSQVFSLGTLFSIAGLPHSALQAKVKNKKLYKIEIVGTFIQTLAMTLLFFPYGIMGIIIGRLIGRAYTTVVSYYLFYKI